MRLRASVVAAVLACAAPLAAQGVPRGPHLVRVVASSGAVVLSIDSSTVARSGDSTFVADAVYQFPSDTSQHVTADRQVWTARARWRSASGRMLRMCLGTSCWAQKTSKITPILTH
jgi:hypothetical protein